jgi:hypothetical protein
VISVDTMGDVVYDDDSSGVARRGKEWRGLAWLGRGSLKDDWLFIYDAWRGRVRRGQARQGLARVFDAKGSAGQPAPTAPGMARHGGARLGKARVFNMAAGQTIAI